MNRVRLLHVVSLVAILVLLAACGQPTPAPTEVPEEKPTEAPAEATEAPTEEATEEPTEAPTEAPPEEVTLVMWDQFGETQGEVIDEIIANFQQEYPHITIQRELYDSGQIIDLAKTAIASGTGPDIVYMDTSPAGDLFRAGLLLPLDDYADEYGWGDRFYPASLVWSTYDGKLGGLGLEYEFVGIFYNKTLFEQEGLEVPQTHEETLAFCRQASELGYIPFAHSGNPGWQHLFTVLMPVTNYLGAEEMEKRNVYLEGDWDTEEVIYAIKTMYEEMRDAGCFIDGLNGLDFAGAQDLFTSGEAFMLPTGTWVIGPIEGKAPPEYEIEMMPWMDNGGPERVYTAGMGSAFYVSNDTAHPAEATLFLDYVFNDASVKAWIEQARLMPPIAVDTSDLDMSPLARFAYETLKAAGTGTGDLALGYNWGLTPQEFRQMVQTGAQAIYDDTITVEEYVADLQEIWDAIER